MHELHVTFAAWNLTINHFGWKFCFFSFRVLCQFEFLFVSTSLAFICFWNLYSFYNLPQFPRLELENSTGTWTHIYGILQIGVYLHNKLLGNTYVNSLPQLRYRWFYFCFNMFNFGVNEVKWHLTPGQYLLYNNNKIVFVVDIRLKMNKIS